MVETADAWQRDNHRTPARSRLDGSWDRAILVQSKVRPVLMMVFNVRPEELAEVVFTEGDDMIQQLAPYGPDPSLAHTVLPGTSDGGPRRLRTEGLDQPIDARGELGVVVRCLIEWERVSQLLRDPSRSWCPRHVEMDDSPPGPIAVDARSAQTVAVGHPTDQASDFEIDSKTARRAPSKLPSPQETEARAMPTDDGQPLR